MCVAKVTNIALYSELFLCAWHYGAGFAVRHYLPDYLSLCAANFPTMSLFHTLILPMPHKDLKQVFFKICHSQMEANIWLSHNCSLLAHPKFDSHILKNWLLVHICMEASYLYGSL